MRFTDSPAVELHLDNTPSSPTTLTFVQDNSSMHVGTSVWPCSLLLAKFVDKWLGVHQNNLYSNLLSFPNKRAIELGSGCGPAGLALHALGLDILLTDIAPVLPALRRNLKRNRPALSRTPKYAQLFWNNLAQIAAARPPFDIVVAADVVYMEDSAAQLVPAMERLVAEDGAVLLGYQVRSPEAHEVFWELCRRTFPVIVKVPREDLHPDYAFEEADVFILRKKPEELQ